MLKWLFKLFRRKYPTKLDLAILKNYDESTCWLCGKYLGPPEFPNRVWLCENCNKVLWE